MRALQLARPGDRLSLLCLGAHSDDIEIGAGAALLSLMERGVQLDVHWCVLSGGGVRDDEARKSAANFLANAASAKIEIMSFRDGFFPEQGEAIKQWFESLKGRIDPDLILTHRRHDAHQDHQQVCRLTWNTFRDHQILEYEIPKWDGDMGRPGMYFPMTEEAGRRKVELLHKCFPSQQGRDWWDDEVFLGLARLRGMECRARYAEAFYCAKTVIDPCA